MSNISGEAIVQS